MSGESNVVWGADAVVACRRQQARVRHREDLGHPASSLAPEHVRTSVAREPGDLVGAYVELRNRKALEDRKAHRYRLITELKSMKGAFDLSSPIKQLETDIAVIDAGLAKLNTAAVA